MKWFCIKKLSMKEDKIQYNYTAFCQRKYVNLLKCVYILKYDIFPSSSMTIVIYQKHVPFLCFLHDKNTQMYDFECISNQIYQHIVFLSKIHMSYTPHSISTTCV